MKVKVVRPDELGDEVWEDRGPTRAAILDVIATANKRGFIEAVRLG